MLTGLRDWLLRLFGRGESEPDIWLFQIKGQRREIGAINDALERAAAAGDVPEPPMRAMQVALDELLTNSIMHGAASDTNPVRVQLVLARNYLRAVITHADSMFDPTQMTTPDTEAGLHERDIGGLGIHLVRNMMDEFEHRYDNGCNVVTIGKRF